MRRLALALAATLLLAGDAHASTAPYVGKVLFHCTPVTTAQVDPIADFGISPSAHSHTSAGASFDASGNPIFTATTSPLAPIAAGSQTSCIQFGEGTLSDHDLIWIPTPYNADGTPSNVTGVAYYLMNNGYQVERPPNGLHFVAGNHSYVGAYGAGEYVGAGCSYSGHIIPQPSTGCTGFQESIFGVSQCWLPYLGEGMGDASPSAQFAEVDSTTCLADGGVQIPEIELVITVQCDSSGCGYLSSDVNAGSQNTYPGSTAHFDFVFGFTPNSSGQDALSLIDTGCLNVTGYTIGQVSCTIYKETAYQAINPNGYANLNDPITN